jgi:hypothetical protein
MRNLKRLALIFLSTSCNITKKDMPDATFTLLANYQEDKTQLYMVFNKNHS